MGYLANGVQYTSFVCVCPYFSTELGQRKLIGTWMCLLYVVGLGGLLIHAAESGHPMPILFVFRSLPAHPCSALYSRLAFQAPLSEPFCFTWWETQEEDVKERSQHKSAHSLADREVSLADTKSPLQLHMSREESIVFWSSFVPLPFPPSKAPLDLWPHSALSSFLCPI